MRRLLASLAFCCLLAAPALAVEYLSAIDDLPLPEGLRESKDKRTVFDSELGRIVALYAEGSVAVDKVRDFYAATLPQLGWEKTANGNWKRGAQSLKIDVLGPEAGPVNVTFTLSSESQ